MTDYLTRTTLENSPCPKCGGYKVSKVVRYYMDANTFVVVLLLGPFSLGLTWIFGLWGMLKQSGLNPDRNDKDWIGYSCRICGYAWGKEGPDSTVPERFKIA